MKLLLDTCTFLWFILIDAKLPKKVLAQICDAKNEAYLSVISIWEIILKHRVGRLKLPKEIMHYIDQEKARNGLRILELDEATVYHMYKLSDIHRDPFDRILVCQALEHGMSLVTPDSAITAYPVKTLWS